MLFYLIEVLSIITYSTAIDVHYAMSNTWFHRNIDYVSFMLHMLWYTQWNELNPRKMEINEKGKLYERDMSIDQCEWAFE